MKRREFLKVAGGVAGSCALGVKSVVAATQQSPDRKEGEEQGLPRRVLGRTGQKVSIVGFSGLALTQGDQQQGTAVIHAAFDKGVNYFDVAPAYGNGDAEVKMGIGLQGIDRSKIFLACKTRMRDKDGARKELERSLTRLKTDHFDLYQMHHIRTPDEVKRAIGPGGAVETFLKAKEEGKVRYFGFSAHTTRGALEAMNGFQFDTVMFPINFIEYFTMDFGKAVLELAKKQGAAVVAIKPMAGGAWAQGAQQTRKYWYRPLEDNTEIDMAMRFTLSQDGVVVGMPPGWLDLVEKGIEVGLKYKPITEPEVQKLQEIAKNCLSIFRREEQQVAHGGVFHEPIWPDSPHECGGYSVA
jgi:predicted aldo/keto reductase-like oxidoreductase